MYVLEPLIKRKKIFNRSPNIRLCQKRLLRTVIRFMRVFEFAP